VKFTTTRAQDKNAAAKILLFEHSAKPVETKRKNLDSFARQAKKISKESIELTSRRVIDTLDRMSEIFLPSDPLLGSAGVFPVYYWFIRESDPKNDQFVREFLNAFEKARKENRIRASNPATQTNIDNELMNFDRLNRSTDDERSHAERFRIVKDRFSSYLETKKK
jgi:hypothetical protein